MRRHYRNRHHRPRDQPTRTSLKRIRLLLGLAALVATAAYLTTVVDDGVFRAAWDGAQSSRLPMLAALALYAGAFLLRAAAWRAVLPGLSLGQSWAALHVALLGNHVLPFRLGEALRATSVLRRTSLPRDAVIASAVTLRASDLAAILVLALVAAPRLAGELMGGWVWFVLAGVLGVATGGLLWLRALKSAAIVLPGLRVAIATLAAWLLESAVMWQAARAVGVHLSVVDAIAVTAVTIAAQTVAVTPGGIGSYEAAATAAMTVLGIAAAPALAVAVLAHATKTAYSLVVGALALMAPAPGYFGRLRLARSVGAMPAAAVPDGPVIIFFPAHDEQESVADVVRRTPAAVCGRPVSSLVIDDGSTDHTAARARAAGAKVISLPRNQGLGAAVRRGLAEAVDRGAAVVVFADADGEYAPEELATVVGPILTGNADYVVGSRFAGRIDSMRPHRRVGNMVLTAALSVVARRRISDGQSGYRAFSRAAASAAEVVHDYNYAQVLTLDLLGKGFRYAEVPISYHFRQTGSSFIRLGRYLRKVVPAVVRELNAQ
ncbi:MAG: lysylphosphatidylglycerol synthase domain-containing protein [Mycobacteriales bacterium]